MKGLNAHINRSNFELVSRLIAGGADINAKYGIGIRPISAAINSGDPEIVEFVVAQGADLNIDNGDPLRRAFDISIDGMIQDNLAKPTSDSIRIIGILIKNGADLEHGSGQGQRPVDMVSAFTHNDESFDLLKSFFRVIIPNIDLLISRY